ncbi:MAG: hypothetical protein B7X57_05780 [Erythrobacter sp. 34-65-8]|nr:MAG: hypothetical protein B7X57_05780 [Erythrobacter sp. 34-65-8]
MAQETQKDIAEKAQALKDKGQGDRAYLERQTPTAGKGAQPTEGSNAPPSGALEAEGQRPVLERSRKVR